MFKRFNATKKRFAAVLLGAALAVSSAFSFGFNSHAAEMEYDPTGYSDPEAWGNKTPINPDDYDGDIKIWFDKVDICREDANTDVDVSFYISGAEGKASAMRFTIMFDSRLMPVKDDDGNIIKPGAALNDFATSEELVEDTYNTYHFNASCRNDSLKDGLLGTITFHIPSDIKYGDIFYCGMQYNEGDIFLNQNFDDYGKKQMAYVFTRGITNGYIQVCSYGTSNECKWNYDGETKTLTISGNGRMKDYQGMNYVPWSNYLSKIDKIVVEEGVTYIGNNSLTGSSTKEIYLPDSLEEIGINGVGGRSGSPQLVEPYLNVYVPCRGSAAYDAYDAPYYLILNYLDHVYDDGIVTKPATVTEKGVRTYTCTVCGHTYTEDIVCLPANSVPQPTPTSETPTPIPGTPTPTSDVHTATDPTPEAASVPVEAVPVPNATTTEQPTTEQPAEDAGLGEDGTGLGKGASAKIAEKKLLSFKGEKDPKGSKFSELQPKASKVSANSISLSWKKASGAKKYIVYGAQCGKSTKYQKIVETKKTNASIKKIAAKKLKKGTSYKFIIVAVDGNDKVVSTSTALHVKTSGGKYGNAKSINTAAKKNSVVIKKGKSFKLNAKQLAASKKTKLEKHSGVSAIRYESSNVKVATVNSKGIIKGVKKGTCKIFVYTQNGVCKIITVKVK